MEMKILKEGKLIDIFVGQCGHCGMVGEVSKSSLESVMDHGEQTDFTQCPSCDNPVVIFFRVNTKDAKAILRKNNLKALYK